MINGAKPNAIEGKTMFFDKDKFFLLIFNVVFLPVKNFKIHSIDNAWEIIVASAAPDTPILNPKIKIGSSTMLKIAPIKTVIMLTFANPWALMKAFNPNVNCTNIVPIL